MSDDKIRRRIRDIAQGVVGDLRKQGKPVPNHTQAIIEGLNAIIEKADSGTSLIETRVLKRGVRYRVIDPMTLEIAWERIVKFGYGPYRPGGKAFKEATKEQELIAQRLVR